MIWDGQPNEHEGKQINVLFTYTFFGHILEYKIYRFEIYYGSVCAICCFNQYYYSWIRLVFDDTT